ncbi:hypothetical protein QJQ45_003228 [Haematococcus lacustris]|nr:hypothetical protein QJQ45_003228 [Haematococcus lacustris]
MQRIGESRWRPLELCFWPDQGALPAKGKEYPGLGYKRVRDKPPKAQEQQQQPAEAHFGQSSTREQAAKVFITAQHVAVDNKGKTGAPCVYKLPGALDKQPEALKTTAPSFSFSQLDREQASGPRPASVPPVGSYDSPSAFGEQVESSRQSPQRMRFSRTTREQAQRVLISSRQLTSQLGTQGADPGQYPLPAAIGPQPSSQRPTMPAFSLPRKDRLQNEFERLGKTLPAPGSYETWKSIGKQALSANRTLPSFGFGTSTWAGSEEKRFISSAHTRLMKGMESPANYDHQTPAMQTSFGRQVVSSRGSGISVSFGGARQPFKTSNTPGPGHYD